MIKPMANRIQTAGFKLTLPRQAVLEVLEQSDVHLTPAEVLERAQAIYPSLGRATVYRTLELLTSLGVVRPIFLGERGVCLTLAEGGHHHLVCNDCGAVIEFDECTVGELEQELAQRLNFQIRGHLLEFYGLCEQCHD
jgi:Fur family transcriptional regulator, ferric uptake regulator